MTDDFDPIERELRRRFDSLETAPDAPDEVLDRMRPRLRRAQRNRRLASAAAVSLVAVFVVVVGLAAFRGGNGGSVHVTPPATHSPSVSTTIAPPDQERPAVSAPDATEPSASGDGATDVTQPQPTGTSAPPPVETPTEPIPAPITAPVNSDTPYSSAGGSIVVHQSGSTISLGSSMPAAGYTQVVHDNGPTRVEVRFNDGQTEWRIRVDLVDGKLQAETTQH